MSMRDCGHSSVLDRLKGYIRIGEGYPSGAIFCGQCQRWLHGGDYQALIDRAKRGIEDEKKRMADRFSKKR